MRTLQPDAVLIMETELWPNLFRECRARRIPVVLINGRVSITSFRRYKMVGLFISRVLNNLSIALMQSEEDGSRIRQLGLSDERVVVTGNLKFDSAECASDDEAAANIRARFGFDGTQPLIVAASTHEPEELIVIDAFKQIKRARPAPDARLLIAPRHPERFGEVTSLLERSGLSWARRSGEPSVTDTTCDVVLLDTIGELRAVYPLAAVAFVGGSIAPHGGHNLLEPAARGICVVTGAHTENFAAVTKALLDENAIVQLPDVPMSEASAKLAFALNELLSDKARRLELGQRGLAVCNRNRGATERTLQMISNILAAPPTADASLPLPAFRVSATK